MKSLFKVCLLAALLYSPLSLIAQKMVLACPFLNGTGREPKEPFSWEPPEQKVVFISYRDTVVRSCVPGEVVTIEPNEDNKYEIVIFYKEHYFWYNNVLLPSVKKMQKLTTGQSIGTYKAGDELELRVYKEPTRTEAEKMIDPRDMLDCKVVKAE